MHFSISHRNTSMKQQQNDPMSSVQTNSKSRASGSEDNKVTSLAFLCDSFDIPVSVARKCLAGKSFA